MSESKIQAKKELSIAIRQARSDKMLSSSQMADLLGVTQKYYAAVERGTRLPSEMFIRFFCILMGLETEPMLKMAGIRKLKKSFDYSKAYKAAGSLIIGLGFATPVLPVSGILAGVGVATVITRLAQAFDATSDRDLAERYLGISASTLSNWRTRGKVPEKYVRFAAKQTHKTIDWFYKTDQQTNLSLLSELLQLFETKQLEKKKTIPPTKKSEILSMLYLRAINRGEIDPEEVEMVVLAST